MNLDDSEKRYAHHMARAAWCGARIILRQVSPESPAIFDFILELYRSSGGDWDALLRSLIQNGKPVQRNDLDRFLTYAATFLSNVGNYYVKFPPNHSRLSYILIHSPSSHRVLEIKSSSPTSAMNSSRRYQLPQPGPLNFTNNSQGQSAPDHLSVWVILATRPRVATTSDQISHRMTSQRSPERSSGILYFWKTPGSESKTTDAILMCCLLLLKQAAAIRTT